MTREKSSRGAANRDCGQRNGCLKKKRPEGKKERSSQEKKKRGESITRNDREVVETNVNRPWSRKMNCSAEKSLNKRRPQLPSEPQEKRGGKKERKKKQNKTRSPSL